MAIQAGTNPPAAGGGLEKTNTAALAMVTTLFFMWGFLTSLNDILVPHLKAIFELNYTKVMFINSAFFGSYFLFAIPAGKLIEKIGYKRTMVSGLMVMGLGALGFVPAAKFASFPIFLAALVILAAGMTTVQVAANPYVTIIGPPATAASRLNLAQAFNSVGTFIAPFLGAALILKGAEPLAPERSGLRASARALSTRPLHGSNENRGHLQWDRSESRNAGARAFALRHWWRGAAASQSSPGWKTSAGCHSFRASLE